MTIFPLLPILFGSVIGPGPSQVKLEIRMTKKVIGFATVSQRVTQDGGKLVQMAMDFTMPDKSTAQIRSENSFDDKGNALRKRLETIVGTHRRQVIATFDKAGANIVIDDGGKRTAKQVSLAEKAPRANVSEFWFIRDHPKVGDKSLSYVLNLDTLSWELTDTRYIGKQTIQINGKAYPCHVMRNDRGTYFVDSNGLPVRIETETLDLVRVTDPD